MPGTNNSTDDIVELETYSMVLSVTTLIITTIFGTSGSAIVFVSLCMGHLYNKSRYIIIASLLILNILLNIVWSPMEIFSLIQYHHGNPVHQDLRFAAHSLYIMLVLSLAGSLIIIAMCYFLRVQRKFKKSSKLLALVGLPLVIFIGFVISVSYGVLSAWQEPSGSNQGLYHILNPKSFLLNLLMLTVIICLLILELVVMLALKNVKAKSENEESLAVSTAAQEQPFTLPTVLIKDTDEEAGTSNPTSGKMKNLLSVNDSKGEEMSTMSELPTIKPSKNKNSLQVNPSLTKLLGRRRHTICQIGDSGLVEPQVKAQNYQYVRKFSVDINALQAQLENPKLHGGKTTFRSSTELHAKRNKDIAMPLFEIPVEKLTPTGPNKPDAPGDAENPEENPPTPSPTPPIITVEPAAVEEQHQTADKSTTYQDAQNFKFCLVLLATYIICIIPMYITEAIHNMLTLNAYVNIVTCTTALSTVQTLIYPHIIICMDSSVHKAVRKLFESLRNKQYTLNERETQSMLPQIESTEFSITQV